MKQLELSLKYEQFTDRSELPEDEKQLLEKAFEASRLAYAPYSEFFVGAAVQLENGEIILGNNQENGAYPSGLCAERTALFAVGAAGKAGGIRKIAIRAHSKVFRVNHPIGPCGACRQVMVEYEKLSGQEMVVIMQGEDGDILKLKGVAKHLLPFTFDLLSLKI